ncbi:MAG: UrcA family protein [Sphingomicrobium sp.]
MLKYLPAIGALIVASALVVPTVSQAAPANSAIVSYADLNLATNAGRIALVGRVAGAARNVCEIEDSRELALASATHLCRRAAIASAQPALDAAIGAVRRGSVTVMGAATLIVSAQ